MNISAIAKISLTVSAMVVPLSAVAYDEGGHLPPGIEVYGVGGSIEDSSGFNVHIIYTNDAAEKVMAFYRKTLGTVPVRGKTFYVGDDNTNSEAGDGGPIYLTVEPASERNDVSISETDLFDTLQENQRRSRMMGNAEHSEREFQQLKQQYKHLAKGWYPTIDVQDKLDACTDEESAYSEDYADESNASATRIQELVAQGKFDEATNLVSGMAQKGMGVQGENTADVWDTWVSCLEELDRHDYQLQVLIGKVHYRFSPPTQAGRENAIRLMN